MTYSDNSNNAGKIYFSEVNFNHRIRMHLLRELYKLFKLISMQLQKIKLFLLLLFVTPSLVAQQRGTPISVTPLFDLTVAETQALINDIAPLDLPSDALNLLSDIDYAIQGLKVVYSTVGVDGNPTTASGLVVVPQSDCAKDMMVYCHGTVYAKQQVPSNLSGAGDGAEVIFGLLFGGNGYLTVLPDYLGLGESPDFHPYVHEDTEASATIDLMIAARTLAAANRIDLTGKAFISGYSQGGHGGMSTFRFLQEVNNLGFDMQVGGLGSGPYDLSGVQYNFILDDPYFSSPAYVLYVMASCEAVYGNIYDAPKDVLRSPYDELYVEHILGQTGDISWVPTPYTDMLKPKFYRQLKKRNNPVQQCLAASNVHDWDNRLPTVMYYCTGDEKVAYQNSIVAEANFEDNLPFYLFWLKPLINSVNVGSGNHSDCVVPYTLAAKLRFDLAQSGCSSSLTTTSVRSSEAVQERLTARPINYHFLDIRNTDLTAPIERVELLRFDGTTAIDRSDFGEQQESIRIDLRQLARGAYIVRLTDAHRRVYRELVLVEPIQLLQHPNYQPISYGNDRSEYQLDVSLLPESVQSLVVLDESFRIMRELEVKEAGQQIDFSLKGLPQGEYTLEVRTAKNSFFLPVAGSASLEQEGKLSVFPNPMQGSVSIRLLDEASIEKVTIHDLQGRVLWQRQNIRQRQIQPDLQLPAGLYQLQVLSTSGKVLTRRLVVQ